MSETHNVVEGCTVYELGEDGGAWFVSGCGSRAVAEAAVLRWLVQNLGDDWESIGRGATELVEAQAQHSGLWWFDPRDDSLKRAWVGRSGIETYSGIAFGIPWVDERHIPDEVVASKPQGSDTAETRSGSAGSTIGGMDQVYAIMDDGSRCPVSWVGFSVGKRVQCQEPSRGHGDKHLWAANGFWSYIAVGAELEYPERDVRFY